MCQKLRFLTKYMQIQERWLEYDLSSLNYFLRETITSKIFKTFEKNVLKASHTGIYWFHDYYTLTNYPN